MKGVCKMAASKWYGDFLKQVDKQRDLELRLKAAWIEYDSTVDSIEGNRREHLKRVSEKNNVSHLDVLEWYQDQPKDFFR